MTFPFSRKVLCHSGYVHNRFFWWFHKSQIHSNVFPFYFYSIGKAPQTTISHDFLTFITNHKLIVRFCCVLCFFFLLFQCISLLFSSFRSRGRQAFTFSVSHSGKGKLRRPCRFNFCISLDRFKNFFFSSNVSSSNQSFYGGIAHLYWQIPVLITH